MFKNIKLNNNTAINCRHPANYYRLEEINSQKIDFACELDHTHIYAQIEPVEILTTNIQRETAHLRNLQTLYA